MWTSQQLRNFHNINPSVASLINAYLLDLLSGLTYLVNASKSSKQNRYPQLKTFLNDDDRFSPFCKFIFLQPRARGSRLNRYKPLRCLLDIKKFRSETNILTRNKIKWKNNEILADSKLKPVQLRMAARKMLKLCGRESLLRHLALLDIERCVHLVLDAAH